jgi:hypothetical protein
VVALPEEPNDAQQSSPVNGQQSTPFGHPAPADKSHAPRVEPEDEPEDELELEPVPTSGFPVDVESSPASAGATEKLVVPQ